jgi:hypothetical protein
MDLDKLLLCASELAGFEVDSPLRERLRELHDKLALWEFQLGEMEFQLREMEFQKALYQADAYLASGIATLKPPRVPHDMDLLLAQIGETKSRVMSINPKSIMVQLALKLESAKTRDEEKEVAKEILRELDEIVIIYSEEPMQKQTKEMIEREVGIDGERISIFNAPFDAIPKISDLKKRSKNMLIICSGSYQCYIISRFSRNVSSRKKLARTFVVHIKNEANKIENVNVDLFIVSPNGNMSPDHIEENLVPIARAVLNNWIF